MEARAKMTMREFHESTKTVSRPHLELLARQSRLGWTVFGNEDIQLE
jgi:N6-adenosine-specific RNA methylase IME4